MRRRIDDPAEVLVCAIDAYGDVLHWGGRLTAELGLHAVDVVGRSFSHVLADRRSAAEILETIGAHGSWRGLVDLRGGTEDDAPSILLELDAVHSTIAVGVGIPIEPASAAAVGAGSVLRDQLTGVGTRALLEDHLELAMARLERRGGVVALYVLALRDLGAVNELHGHLAGDAALMEVAERLAAVVRAEDTVARCRGAAFAVVCELADEGQAEALAGRLGAVALEDGPHVGLALGAVIVRRRDRSAAELLRAAEHQAAAGGRETSSR